MGDDPLRTLLPALCVLAGHKILIRSAAGFGTRERPGAVSEQTMRALAERGLATISTHRRIERAAITPAGIERILAGPQRAAS
jgi:hypothetical protein